MHAHAHIHQAALQRRRRMESKEKNRLTLICTSTMHLYCADLCYAHTHMYLLEDGHTRDPRGGYCLTLFCIQTVYRFPILRRMRVYVRASEWVRENVCVCPSSSPYESCVHIPCWGGGAGGGGHEWTSSVVQSDSSFLDASTVSCTDCESGRKRGNDRGRGLEGRECA
jgi:hypothetical protein